MPAAAKNIAMRTLGINIRKCRKRLSWTQVVLSGRSGINAKELSSIEMGRRNCSLATITKIANALGVTPDYLLKEPRPVHSRPTRPVKLAPHVPDTQGKLELAAHAFLSGHPEATQLTVFQVNDTLETVATVFQYPGTARQDDCTLGISNHCNIVHLSKSTQRQPIRLFARTLQFMPSPKLLLIEFEADFSNTVYLAISSSGSMSNLNDSVTLQGFCDAIRGVMAYESQMINQLKAAVDTYLFIASLKDPITAQHANRVAHYVSLSANVLASAGYLTFDQARYLSHFAAMHDIGKLSIPDHIINKAGKLTTKEFQSAQNHSLMGAEVMQRLIAINPVLQPLPFKDMLIDIIMHHHEKLDGSGYPDHLVAKQISFPAQLVAVIDIFEALTAWRPYKHAWSVKEAIKELELMAERNKVSSICVNALKCVLEARQTFPEHRLSPE